MKAQANGLGTSSKIVQPQRGAITSIIAPFQGLGLYPELTRCDAPGYYILPRWGFDGLASLKLKAADRRRKR